MADTLTNITPSISAFFFFLKKSTAFKLSPKQDFGFSKNFVVFVANLEERNVSNMLNASLCRIANRKFGPFLVGDYFIIVEQN